MDRARWLRHRLVNGLQTALLLAVLGALAAGIAWRLLGPTAALLAAVWILPLWLAAPRLSPAFLLRAFRAEPISPAAAPELCAAVAELARRAGLPAAPALYYLPSDVMNAFALGTRRNAAIVLSDGLLRRLDLREVTAVVAHEVAHLANDDLRVMGLADLASRVTVMLSHIGILLAALNLPLALFGASAISWWTILLLLTAPILSALAQLALSRTREFDADAEAARLIGDPRPLASALSRMERWKARLVRGALVPMQRLPDPSLLRSHPATEERIRRLLSLAPSEPGRAAWPSTGTSFTRLAADPIPARWHRSGLWF